MHIVLLWFYTRSSLLFLLLLLLLWRLFRITQHNNLYIYIYTHTHTKTIAPLQTGMQYKYIKCTNLPGHSYYCPFNVTLMLISIRYALQIVLNNDAIISDPNLQGLFLLP